MINKYFINQGIKEARIEEFIKKKFPQGDYSKTEIQRTPLGVKILIYTNKPGSIIGKGGRNINEMTEAIKNEFSLENPQLDVKVIKNPNLDAKIVAKQIASALEKGYNYKKIGNLTLKRILDAGAVGAQITIAGKLGGGKGIRSKFVDGYLKHCGQPAKDLVDYGFEEAMTKPGKIGIKVKIMQNFQEITGEISTRTKEKAKEARKAYLEEEAEEKNEKEKDSERQEEFEQREEIKEKIKEAKEKIKTKENDEPEKEKEKKIKEKKK